MASSRRLRQVAGKTEGKVEGVLGFLGFVLRRLALQAVFFWTA